MIDPEAEQTALSRRATSSRAADAAPGDDTDAGAADTDFAAADADTTRVVRDASRGGTTVPTPGPRRGGGLAAPAPAGTSSSEGRVAARPVADDAYPARHAPSPGAARGAAAIQTPQQYVDTAAVEAHLRRGRRRRAIAVAVAASVVVIAAALALVLLLTIG